MAELSGTEISAASGCGKGSQNKAKLHPCANCSQEFHTYCGNFVFVLKDGGGTEKFRGACILLRNSESAQKSRNPINPRSCSSSRYQSPATSTHSSCANEGGKDVLQDIFKKLEFNSKQLGEIDTELEPHKFRSYLPELKPIKKTTLK